MPGARAWGLKTFQPLHVPLPSPWERLLDVPHHSLCLKAISVLHRLGVVKEVGSVWGFLKCPKAPANLPSWGNMAFLVMVFDVCSQARLVSACPGPHEMLRLQLREERGRTIAGGHWVHS